MAFPIDGGADPSNVQPLWITRCFDSIYSVAISEKAVYIGGHFTWNESPTAPDPWPGLDNVGYGTGQGLSGYGLGDAVVRRDHLGALDPATGKALEWNPGSKSVEGNKAMQVTSRGLFTGGDTIVPGWLNVGRVAFFDLSQLPRQRADRHHDHRPDRGSGGDGGHAVHHHRPRQGRQRWRQPGPAPGQGHAAATSACRTTSPRGAPSNTINATLSNQNGDRCRLVADR